MATELPERVLIVRLGAIGDVVNAQVVANAIKEARPDVRVDWVVHDLARPLVEGHPSIDRVHLLARAGGLGGARELLRRLRSERYGLAIDLQRIAKSGAIARLSGAPRVVGFDRGRCKELNWLWSTERIAPGRPGTHMLEWYLEFVDHLGLPRPRTLHRLPRDESAERWAERELAQLGAAPVIVNLGASRPFKRWPEQRFGELIGALASEGLGPVGLTAGRGDAARAAAVVSCAGQGTLARSWAGATSLLQLAELARRARLLVTCDTGPMHLAVAVGTPVVALFGPGDPRRTGPWGAGHQVVRSPTGRMQDLTVEAVLEAVRAAAAQTPQARSARGDG